MKPQPPGAVASLVFGILALIAWFIPAIGMVMGVLAITCSRRAASSLAATPETYEPGGLHLAGLVTGIVGLVLSSLVMVWAVLLVGIIGALAALVTGHPVPASPAQAPLLW
jgi:hypothetical protein